MRNSKELSQQFVSDLMATIHEVGHMEFFAPLLLSLASGRALCDMFEKIEQAEIAIKERYKLNHIINNPGTDEVSRLYLADIYEDVSDDGNSAQLHSSWDVDNLDIVRMFLYQHNGMFSELKISMFFADEKITCIEDVYALKSLYLQEKAKGGHRKEIWVSPNGTCVRVTTHTDIPGQTVTTQENYFLLPV